MVLVLLSVLASAEPFDHDHATFRAFLEGAVSVEGVDYGQLATRRPLLDRYLAQVAAAPLASFSRDQRLALWIDAYNACTIRIVLDERPLASIRDLDGGKVWSTRTCDVGGESLTLDQLEHQRIRPLGDARIHAAVVCAAKGCPPLAAEPFVAARLDAQLDAASRQWAASTAYHLADGSLQLSRIFEWFPEDFVAYRASRPGLSEAQDGAVGFLVRYVEAGEALLAGQPTVAWKAYDWSLNQR